MTLEQLAANAPHWPILKELVRSEQIPSHRMADIARDFPGAWAFCIEI